MNSIPCAPASWNILFSDPVPNEEMLLNQMIERASAESNRSLAPTLNEMKSHILLRFLRSQHHDVECAMREWSEWVTWRHGIHIRARFS